MKDQGFDVREQGMPVSNDLRKSRRVNYYSKVFCTKYISGGAEVKLEEPIELTLLNISTGGIGVLSPVPFQKDSLLVLNITLEEEHYERVSARIIWETPKEDRYRYGLVISNISGKLFTHISMLDNSIETEV